MHDQAERRTWQGTWIWREGMTPEGTGNQLVWFRRSFHVPVLGCVLKVHVSADSRYRFFVNGFSVGIGPCKGDGNRQYFETYDLTPFLQRGDNLISVKVLHYGMGGASTLSGSSSIWRSPWGAFVMDGVLEYANGDIIEELHTDEKWECRRAPSYSIRFDSWMSATWLGGMERVDGNIANDSDWNPAVVIKPVSNSYGSLGPWPLIARPIPMLFEKPAQFVTVIRREGVSDDWQVMPGNSGWVELDAGELTTGYPQLELIGGKGATAYIRYAECYEGETSDGKRKKGVRDDWSSEGQKLVGDADEYVLNGRGTAANPETYEPFWYRTFRYVRLEITAGDEPVGVARIHYRETGYPLQVKADFQCSDPSFTPLWDISLRTLQRCMHESYEDCPYYEQLQYTMDTALQALFTYYVSGDDRLGRKAIHDYHSSRLPDGMLQCRVPSVEPQVIPGFALYWIGMLHDHYQFYGDTSYIRTYLSTADGVLDWFRRHIGSDGLVGPADSQYWSFVDWVADWPVGIPPANQKGPMTVYNLIFATALQQAAEMNDAIGRISTAEEYRQLARQINQQVKQLCWSEEDQLFRDGPTVKQYSQHAQLWSVLSGLVSGEEATLLMKAAIENTDLAQASYPMAFFLFRAISKAGVYQDSFSLWKPWKVMVANNLTTWQESPNGTRSDCHAWGALPLYEFPAELLGVKAANPGFSTILIEPKPGHLSWAEGTVVTPHGLVKVRWETGGDEFRIQVKGPADVPVVVKLPNGQSYLYDSCVAIEITV